MDLSKDDAVAALEVVGEAGDRMLTLKRYSRVAPVLMTWGFIWLIADSITDFAPGWSDDAWLVGTVVGVIISALFGFWTIRSRAVSRSRRDMNLRYGMTAVTILCLFPSVLSVIGPLTPRQSNALISLLWAFLYMVVGPWLGWRVFAIGAVAAAATLFGYWSVQQHYYLWMAVCGGGSLIAGGVWLRKI